MKSQTQSNREPKWRGNGSASSISIFAEQAFWRAAGAGLIPGNSARILKDAAENYPAWLEAIESARRTIYFESYVIHEDEQGRIFADALIRKARDGVKVRLIYDWMGAFSSTSNRFWRRLREAGVEVRCFNPPRCDNPFGWLGRDHRKMLSIDGRVGFVSGLCVGQLWVGDERKGIEPWRDTGIEIRGPAVVELERAFAQMWAACGQPIPAVEFTDSISPIRLIQDDGDVALRIVASMPYSAGLYRLDQMITAAARETLWLTDAYFAGTTPYIQALSAASRDGVDVRLLVPQATDIPVMRALSRTGYRPLLESSVRVYEWNGPMIHAKTAVADGRWARIGSTNLNPASWVSNWELDVVIEDKRIGEEMEQMFLDDLENATEMVLTVRQRLAPASKPKRHPGGRRLRKRIGSGSSSRAAAGAIQIGRTVSAAITNRRALGPAESRIMGGAGVLLVAASVIAVMWPRVISLPLAVIGVWVAVSAFIRAFHLRREGKREEVSLKSIQNEIGRNEPGQ
ncbi:MAG TPA: phospholipase D-like domain-containing protein [Blastocatellia bacterium]|jgi:Phosphatidylserine/phosphatidylglycerophosphate/cardiolipin synthases and related enzymes